MKFFSKSLSQKKLPAILGLVNHTGEVVAILDRSGHPVGIILSARDYEQIIGKPITVGIKEESI